MYFNNEQSVSDSECVNVCAPGCQSACVRVRAEIPSLERIKALHRYFG